MLIAEPRADKNGKVVTRHVKNGPVSLTNIKSVPAPALPASDIAEVDDLNVMSKLGIYDTSSAACERVESYLEDEYGATFEYDLEEGVETVTFQSSREADRFASDFAHGDLRDELKEIANDY